ncbi:MAG: type II toxin-antitoxin system HicA family toxin [Bryobacteraceae bacterium]|nr:type II toxin-antitoxin system HicA family toxin [Bryobacteraceae bacterium]
MTIKVRDLIRILERDGWVLHRQPGTSHRQYRKPGNPFVITVHGKPGNDMPVGTLKEILKKSGLTLG